MNFLAHCEDRSPAACRSGHGRLEAKLSFELGLVESAHEILDLVKDPDVASSEGGTKEARTIPVSPPMLVRAIPNTESSLLIGRPARERNPK